MVGGLLTSCSLLLCLFELPCPGFTIRTKPNGVSTLPCRLRFCRPRHILWQIRARLLPEGVPSLAGVEGAQRQAEIQNYYGAEASH